MINKFLQAVTKLTASGRKSLVIAGMAALTEGEVVRADEECTVIRYYHEWDGTYYQYVRSCQLPDYQTGKRVPVVYTIGMGSFKFKKERKSRKWLEEKLSPATGR